MRNIIRTLFGKIMPSLVRSEKGVVTAETIFVVIQTLALCINSGYNPKQNPAFGDFDSECNAFFAEGDSGELCVLSGLTLLDDCNSFLKANGVKNAAVQNHAMNDVNNACGTTNPAPACSPGQCQFAYSNWSDCKPNGQQTRTELSRSPDGCIGAPQLTQSCTFVPQPCVFTYDFDTCDDYCWKTDALNCCEPSNICIRSVKSVSPDGCVGEPSLTLACAYQPPQCKYQYDCKCQPDNTCTPTVSSATPSGCTGTPDLTPKACTFCTDPSHPVPCSDNLCYPPGFVCCQGGNAAPPGYICCNVGGALCPNSKVCVGVLQGCCPIATPYLCSNGYCCATPQ